MNEPTFTPGADGKSMVITRKFDAPVAKVWEAYTTQAMLEQWWAPEPWKAVTKEFDFSEGGRWLYAMTGPEGEVHWSLEEFVTIDEGKSFYAKDYFCDEEGNPNKDLPGSTWTVAFEDLDGQTQVTVNLVCNTPEDLQKMTEMGFKEGFTQGLKQLEALLIN